MHEVERRPPRRRDGATEGPRGTHPFDPVLLILYVFSRLFPVNCEGRRTRVLVCARVSGAPPGVFLLVPGTRPFQRERERFITEQATLPIGGTP